MSSRRLLASAATLLAAALIAVTAGYQARADEFTDAVDFFRAAVRIRRDNRGFRLKASSELLQNADVIQLKSKSVLYALNDGAALLIVFKPLPQPETVVVPASYRPILGDAAAADAAGAWTLPDIGAYVFQKRDE